MQAIDPTGDLLLVAAVNTAQAKTGLSLRNSNCIHQPINPGIRPMQLYFIRHAQSTNNALWDATQSNCGRSDDPELTPMGREQARRLGVFLSTGNPRGGYVEDHQFAGFGLTHLYCSLMSRSIETAWAVSQATGLPLEAWIDLHEEGGMYLEDEATGERNGRPGKPRSYFMKKFPGVILPPEVTEEGWYNGHPFECDDERPLRARRVLQLLLDRHGDTQDRVAIVSHGGFYNHLLHTIFFATIPHIWGVMYNTGITRIDFNPDFTDIIYMNRTDFLPAEMVS
jgi:2,3-bisphosphoglycerate-dependent phosphoglycerate mutase